MLRVPEESAVEEFANAVRSTRAPLNDAALIDAVRAVHTQYKKTLEKNRGVLDGAEIALQAKLLLLVLRNQQGDYGKDAEYYKQKLAEASLGIVAAHGQYAGPAASLLKRDQRAELVRDMEHNMFEIFEVMGLESSADALFVDVFKQNEPLPYEDFLSAIYNLHAREELEEDRGEFDDEKLLKMGKETAQMISDQARGGTFSPAGTSKRMELLRRSRMVLVARELVKLQQMYDATEGGNPYKEGAQVMMQEAEMRHRYARRMADAVEQAAAIMGYADPDK